MSTAKYTLRQMIGRLIGTDDRQMVTGTPTGGYSTSGFQCSGLALDEDSFYNTWLWRCYIGTHKDTTREVTTFTKSGGTFVFSPVVTGAIDATDLFELHRDFTPEEIDAAINLAILTVENEALEDKVDETLTVIASTWEYTVPTGFVTIADIFQESSTADLYYPRDRIQGDQWDINRGTTKKIWINPSISLITGRGLRVVGQSKPSALSLDASTTEVNANYIVQQAMALLHQSRSGAEHERQRALAQTLAERERLKVRSMLMGKKV